MKKIILFIAGILIISQAIGQKLYSLDECIDIALRNSIKTKLAVLAISDADIDLFRAKQFQLPNANAGIGHGLNFGRSIDPSTNGFINEQITRGGFNGNAYLPIWQDGALVKNILSSKYADTSAQYSLKSEQSNLKLQVTLAYLQLLTNKELAVRADLQEKTTANQLTRLKNMASQGAVVPNQVADMQGQFAQDQINTLASKQQIKAARLFLLQLMNLPYDESFDIQNETNAPVKVESMSKLVNALTNHPMIKAQEAQTKSAEYNLAYNKAQRVPQLGLSFNLGSSYSSAYRLNNAEVSYPKQLSNNFNYSGLIGLDIPILSGGRVRSAIKKSENAIARAKANTELAKNTIQQQIEEAKFQLNAAEEKFHLAEVQTKAFEESFKIAESRFNNGVTNSTVEYILAKKNYDQSQNQLIMYKYELSFRKSIVDLYSSF